MSRREIDPPEEIVDEPEVTGTDGEILPEFGGEVTDVAVAMAYMDYLIKSDACYSDFREALRRFGIDLVEEERQMIAEGRKINGLGRSSAAK